MRLPKAIRDVLDADWTKPFILRDSENSEMPGRKKAAPKPAPTAYSRVTGKDWKQKLSFIRSANEQEVATPTDVSALFEYIDKLETHLNRADAAWTDNPGSEQALDVVRKVAGIAVHCMEDHETPPRMVMTPIS